MSRIFYKGTHKFINPKRTRARFYDKNHKKYYSIWITNGMIKTTATGSNIILCNALTKLYKHKKYTTTPIDIEDYTWDII